MNLAALGLMLDIVGAASIFRFVSHVVATPDVSTWGRIEEESKKQFDKKIRRHLRWSRVGFGVMLIGFILQFCDQLPTHLACWC